MSVQAGATVGDVVVEAVPRATAGASAGEARDLLAAARYDWVGEVAVVDGGRLVGAVPVEDVLSAPAAQALVELALGPVTVASADELEVAARRSAQNGGRSVAVVDAGRFRGFVPASRLVGALELEHEEDMARLGGYLASTSTARLACEEAVPRRLWHRLPWLALGLVGAMGSALVVGAFEDDLRQVVLLSFFVPAVVYMADAVGTQTETVVIRGMAVGVPLRDLVGRELLTGGVIGSFVAIAFLVFALAVWNDARVAATVAIALFISCSVATVVAMVLPYALASAGRDPAFGSGPLATVIQDLLSIAAYFAVATALV